MNQIIEGISIIICCLIQITYQQNEKYKRCTYGGNVYFCHYGKSCCGSDCCWQDGALFYHFWYVWLILGILALLGCIGCAIKCYESSEPSTSATTQNITHTVTTHSTASSGANTTTRHNVNNGADDDVEMNFFRNFGQSEPLFTDCFNGFTNANHSSNFTTTTHHFDSSNPQANCTTTTTHYSGNDPTFVPHRRGATNNHNTTNQRSNSPPRSRHQSGHANSAPCPTAPAADEGVASDAPPSYFDAVYKGKGEHINMPSAPNL